jgi:hypothetical protein
MMVIVLLAWTTVSAVPPAPELPVGMKIFTSRDDAGEHRSRLDRLLGEITADYISQRARRQRRIA